MLKKRWIVLFVALFLMSALSAMGQDTIIYSEEKYGGDEFNIGPMNIIVDRSFRVDKVTLLIDGSSLTVRNNSCRVYQKTFYFCLEGIEQDFDRIDEFTNEPQNKYTIEVRQLVPAISIVLRNVTPSQNLQVGSTIEVYSVVKNVGDLLVEGVSYSEIFDDEIVKPSRPTGCTIRGSEVYWEEDLARDEEKHCSFYLLAINGGTAEAKGTVTFFDGVEDQEISTARTSLVIGSLELSLETEITRTKLKIGQQTAINVRVENNENREFQDVTVAIEIPGEFDLPKKDPNLMLTQRKRGQPKTGTYNFNIGKDDVFKKSVIISPTKGGRYKIKITLSYYEKRVRRVRTIKDEVIIEVLLPQIFIDIDQFKKVVASGEQVPIKFVLSNTFDQTFIDLEAEISTNIPGIESGKILIPELAANTDEVLIDTVVTLTAATTTKYYLDVNLTYHSKDYKTQYASETLTMRVDVPQAQQQEVTTPTEAEEGGTEEPPVPPTVPTPTPTPPPTPPPVVDTMKPMNTNLIAAALIFGTIMLLALFFIGRRMYKKRKAKKEKPAEEVPKPDEKKDEPADKKEVVGKPPEEKKEEMPPVAPAKKTDDEKTVTDVLNEDIDLLNELNQILKR